MQKWDTRALHREACDAFTTATSIAERGKALLDEISEIGSLIERLDKLEEVHVGSFNDSCWNPNKIIDQKALRHFIIKYLDDKRTELRRQFNQLGK